MTEPPISLREFIEHTVNERFKGLEALIDARFDGSDRLSVLRWSAHDHVHKLLAEALDKQEIMAKENKLAANEWRATVTDLTGRFITRELMESQLDTTHVDIDKSIAVAEQRYQGNSKRIDDLEKAAIRETTRQEEQRISQVSKLDAQHGAQVRQQWVISAAIAVLAILSGILSRVVFQ